MMENKEHLTEKGFNTILEKYKTMNSNRSFSEKYEYLLNKNFSINKDWLIGFIESEGTFYCYMSKIEEENQFKDNIIIPNTEHTISKNLFINLYIKFISLWDSISDAVTELATLLYISLLSTTYLLTL